ncbi:MAG: hypothetical protein A3G28_01500 [Betaproteobacteria bacterium RIFCSPLOWO2_12_FULL_68_19]|nr:MAG: hypothetical protein A3G28_01500 [Betaproteobacteria bacterium RIFCSPLOWO2_12_FULL_68_19]
MPRRELAFLDERGGFSLTLKRNCSNSPAGFACACGALAVAALAIGTGFALAGAWLVLPFAGLEALALGAAFVLYARHAADYERIELGAGRLTVEVADAQRSARYELDARRVQVCVRNEHGVRVVLRGPKEELEVGRNLDAEARLRFAAELDKRLRI